mmetsp:Transcript_70410/g.116906  ORF Transcript_70410/g.116906 Transcript_70410/m.116906 type:complete len:91 (-) Transcript_70410:350-622(-)
MDTSFRKERCCLSNGVTMLLASEQWRPDVDCCPSVHLAHVSLPSGSHLVTQGQHAGDGHQCKTCAALHCRFCVLFLPFDLPLLQSHSCCP